jgi:hypothetical protein
MANEFASTYDSTEQCVESQEKSTASRLFEEALDLILGSKREAPVTNTDAVEAVNAPTESGVQDTTKVKAGPSDSGTTTEKKATAAVGRGDTRPSAGGGVTGPASGSGRGRGTPRTLADDVADNVKEHPVATGIETLLFPPLVILDTAIRKLVDKPVPRTSR